MESCLFCNIAARKIPAAIVFEDEAVVAFLDIHPVSPGHTLVIPKEHYEDVVSTPPNIFGTLASRLPKLGAAIASALKVDGFNVSFNNGAAAGQVIGHVHAHIIPRIKNDGHRPWDQRDYQEGEAAVVAEKIRSALT